MVITLVDEAGKKYAKDILNIAFDMSIEEKSSKYLIRVNNVYFYDQVFSEKEQAEEQFFFLVNARNALEQEYRDTV